VQNARTRKEVEYTIRQELHRPSPVWVGNLQPFIIVCNEHVELESSADEK
jgi:hypothetical protein